jgi:inhibitor of KinA
LIKGRQYFSDAMRQSFRIYACGESVLTIQLTDIISPEAHSRVMALVTYLHDAAIPFVQDIIPAYTGVSVVIDPIAYLQHYPQQEPVQWLTQQMNSWKWSPEAETIPPIKQIPVCYHLSMASDLTALAKAKNLSVEDVIQLHTQTVYHVYMIGFMPGFPYMGNVADAIQMPRLAVPRTKVVAGSVGIAGQQTGIYPQDSPGGWNIIGRTPYRLFDATKEHPCLLQAGDRVQFYAIDLDEFDVLSKASSNFFNP